MPISQLKIKTNVVKRIHKEHVGYLQEAETQQKRIDKLIANNADEADVKKQKEVLAETHQMIPDVKKRLAKAYEDLQDALENIENADSNEVEEAKQVLSDIPADISE
ncbi:tubulin binding cofactor A [Mycotypha africana]|uniref:tubulin binding cofactor A n=1 Tax=Mycotypha africana TaxID=64632 RepID=UPI00230027F3|nr:tubulin binding cofactor A [Mycotypha africana]KAI8977538.1 tubulin binding cofactor A [Mycotypha africana]